MQSRRREGQHCAGKRSAEEVLPPLRTKNKGLLESGERKAKRKKKMGTATF